MSRKRNLNKVKSSKFHLNNHLMLRRNKALEVNLRISCSIIKEVKKWQNHLIIKCRYLQKATINVMTALRAFMTNLA
jgi:hypothetical protein